MFSHLDASGKPTMVNVGSKTPTLRMAHARTTVALPPEVAALLQDGDLRTHKGSVLQTAVIAGIMAAKKTGELIPLCHPIGLDDCQIEIQIVDNQLIVIDCRASVFGKTGVEMEALTGATVAALTIYDMCKAFSHNIIIQETKLMAKKGGKRDFDRT